MREILFRGKRTGDGQWVYGYYFAKPILEKHFIEIGEEQFLVNRETVGQYTGLVDKNGTRIFEGDIVKYSVKYGGRIAVVNFSTRGCFCCKTYIPERLNRNNPAIDIVLADSKNEIEVIGNIHNNPELLEA